ncbi:flavin-containing monooxygenase [Nocardioides zeae]|uniref:Dimethylaniline monooxygenase (N-oxide forming) n=1 Tax=Nocardioides zeae TaxID=1457234 RepID=A0AAJ1X1E7_9ACTN|nr:NAD(P)/FAD-dependent oxidoreductase [Nocardioides zeae]MDQ1104826.1 dimethylaniline monooxygenase (N-oxide forming) [Nocardioides zeae]
MTSSPTPSPTKKKIGIVGAGFAGLSSARVLSALGHDVTVWEKTPDVGGVWSATRRYPGLKTQNDKGTYALSELPMPKDYPEWPSGAQVQAYLEQYVEKFGLEPHLRLSTEVVAAEPTPSGGWDVTTADAAGTVTTHVDHLVLASGIFSRPFVPPWEGRDVFEKVGGEVLPAGDLHSLDQVAGKDAIIVGYGKSACDITVEVSTVAASTTVVARELLWKLPRKLQGVLNYKFLMLTRLGEGLFRYRSVNGMEKVLHARDSLLANQMVGSVGGVSTRQLKLAKLDLIPQGTFADIARSTVSLATEGFFEGVADGRITVHRDIVISRLGERDGKPIAELADGTVIPADVVLAATGWTQEIPFLPDDVVARFTNAQGDYLLHRQIHPIGVEDLSFAGYNSSFFSPLSAEVSALWIGSYLGGGHTLPDEETMRAEAEETLDWMRERTRGQHARGTNIIPFSVHNIDETLDDLDLNVGKLTKAKQWLLPLDPSDYAGVLGKLRARLAR